MVEIQPEEQRVAAEQGAELMLNIEGSDEQEALETLTGLFESNFGREVV